MHSFCFPIMFASSFVCSLFVSFFFPPLSACSTVLPLVCLRGSSSIAPLRIIPLI
jgi:hypothetical protein